MKEIALPFPANENERLTALASYHVMDSGEEKDFDAIAAIASAICQTPISLITFIDAKRQWFKSHIGTDLTENFRDLSFCTHVIAGSEDIMIIPDATKDERFAGNPIVTEANVSFYAGVPLVNEDGFALGTICVLDQQTHEFNDAQIEALKGLAKQVVDKLELRRKIDRLEKANQELLNANVLIQKFASMAAHDIKNPLSSIKLTSQALRIRLDKLNDEACTRLINLNLTSTDNLLGLVDEMLAYSKNPGMLIEKKSVFNVNALITKVLSLLVVPDNVKISLPEGKHSMCFSTIAFEQILINLLTNAIRYNNKTEGRVDIRFAEDEDFYRLEIADNGMGISEKYHEKIFSNNFTLKITDRYNQNGSGIGLSTVKDLLNVLNSNIYVQSAPGEGATFYVNFRK